MSTKRFDKSIKPFNDVYKIYDVTNARRIGSGGFGKVYLIRDRDTNKKYAAKYQKLASSKLKELVRSEAMFLRELSEGKRIVDMRDYYEKNDHSLMVIEYLEAGDLFSKISSITYNLTEEKCRSFVTEIAKALEYIHGNSIIHLDLKPANVMLRSKADEFKLKLIDFGLAKRLNSQGVVKVGFCGTVGFMAPEIARCQYRARPDDLASPASDMFSLGVMTYMLVSGGREPFWEGNDVRGIKNTLHKDPDFSGQEFKKVSQNAKNFINELLNKKSVERPSARKSLSHEWLKRDEVDGGRRPGSMRYSKVDTMRMRKFQARWRWWRAIRRVIVLNKVKDQFILPELV